MRGSLHEEYYALLYRRFCVEVDGDAGSYGTYHDSSFHAYYCNLGRITGDATVLPVVPYDILDAREAQRKRSNAAAREREEEEEEVKPVELSAYEKMRAERVVRNKERLKLLGLG